MYRRIFIFPFEIMYLLVFAQDLNIKRNSIYLTVLENKIEIFLMYLYYIPCQKINM